MTSDQMNIDKLKILIEQHVTSDQVQGAVLRITGDNLLSEEVKNIFSTGLEGQTLVIHGVAIERTGDTVTITGHGTGVPFEGMEVQAVFGLNADNKVTAIITVTVTTDAALDWKFTQSFPALKGTVYEDIHLSDPKLVLSTEDTDTAKKGLSFSGTLTWAGALSNIKSLWQEGHSLQISGGITLTDSVPTMGLTVTEASPTHIGYFDLPLTLSLISSPGTKSHKIEATVQLSSALQYSHNGTALQIPLLATFETAAKTLKFVADVTNAANTGLADLASFLLDKENVVAVLPTNFSLNSALALGQLTLLVDLQTRELASVTLEVSQGAPWDAFGNTVKLEEVHVLFGLDQPLNKEQRKLSCDMSGAVRLGDKATYDATLHAPDFVTKGTLKAIDDSGLSLTGLLTSALGVHSRPDELPDLVFSALDIFMTPAQGDFQITGEIALSWSQLPLGLSGSSANTVNFTLKRETVAASSATQPAQHELTCQIVFTGKEQISVVDNLSFQDTHLTFALNVEQRTWAVSGSIDATILNTDCMLIASIDQSATARTLKLHTAFTPGLALSLGSGATLTAEDLAIKISKALSAASAAASDGEVKLHDSSSYTWSISATASAQVPDVFEMRKGTLKLWSKGKSIGLAFSPDEAILSLPLGSLQPMTVELALERLAIVGAGEKGHRTWSFDTDIGIWFAQVPDKLQLAKILPSTQDRQVDCHLIVDEKGAQVTVDSLVSIDDLDLGEHDFGVRKLNLGKAAIEVSHLTLQLGKEISLSTDFGFGIPSELNYIFGKKDDGTPAVEFFNVYDARAVSSMPPSAAAETATTASKLDNPTITRIKIDLDSKKGLQAQLQNSPIKAITSTQAADGTAQYEVDLGEFGAFSFAMPTFSTSGNSFSASGSFKQVPGRDLKLPLTPIKYLFEACKLQAVADTIPNGLPIKGVKIYEQTTGKLAGQELVNLLDALGKELSGQAKNYTFALDDGLAKALSELDSLLSRLPSSFLDYLDISIPQDFSFSISVTDEGTCQCDLSTDTPIKVLYPTIGPLGPQLNGITLRGFSVGEMFGGAVIPVRIDADLHQFNLPTLIAALAIPQDSHLPLPDAKNIVTKLVIHNLFMLVIYETVIPIPVPVFFDELGIEYLGIEGLTFQTHGQFPNPLQNVGLSDFLTLLKALEKFFTQADYLLDPSALPHLLPTFTFAPNNIQLPPYMGGRTLVDPKDPKYNPTLDATTSLAHLLNFLKTLNINEIIQSIPLGKRVGPQHVSFACMELDADWLITTLHEFMMLTPAQQAVAQLRASEIDTLIHVLPAVQSQALVTSLTTQIAAREQQLQAQNAAAQQQIATLQAQIPAMQTQIAATQAQIQQVTNQIQALQQSPSPAVGPVLGGLLAQRVALQARLAAQQTAFNQLQAILAVAQHTIVNIATDPQLLQWMASLQQAQHTLNSAPQSGMVLFLKGGWQVASVASLMAYFGLVGSSSGFSTAMRITGSISDLVALDLSGAVSINAKAQQGDAVVSLQGKSLLSILNQQAFSGSLALSNNRFDIDGTLSLPSGWAGLFGNVHLAGHLSNTELYLMGSAMLAVGNFTLAGGSLTITHISVTVTGTWLNQTLTLSAQKVNNMLLFQAMLSPLTISNILQITGPGPQGGPSATLGLSASSLPYVSLGGTIALPLIKTQGSGNFHIDGQGFSFTISGQIFGVFGADLTITGTNMQDAATFTISASMRNDLVTYLQQATRDALNSEVQTVNSSLDAQRQKVADAEQKVKNAQKDVNDATVQFQQKIAGAQQDVDKAQRDVNDLQWKIDHADSFSKAFLELGKAAADKALELAQRTLQTVSDNANNTIMAPARAALRLAQDELKADNQVLAGLEQANSAAISASQYIAQHTLAGLLIVHSASFTAQYSAASGGHVTMSVNLDYQGSNSQQQIDFDFNNREDSAKAFARKLLPIR